jgi:nucleoporin POM152
MSPISTAQLNHHGLSFCLAPPDNFVLIPVLLNNTHLSGLRYSLARLGHDGEDSREYVDVTAKDFKAIEQSRLERLERSRPPSPGKSDEYDEYDDDNDHSEHQTTQSSLQSSQTLVYIRLSKPGTLRLERVLDGSGIDARLHYPLAVTVVPCPRVEFVEDDIAKNNIHCAGQDSALDLMIDIHGVPPLSLRWLKTINGQREQFLVEGIEDGHEHGHTDTPKSTQHVDPEISGAQEGALVWRTRLPQALRIPLTVPLDIPGTYLYALEEVMDAVGNVVRIGSDLVVLDSGSASQTKTTRSLMVLRRPTVSFRHCGLGTPASLLIGSDVPLTISANEADDFDAPWEISLNYQPLTDVDGNKGGKRSKAWKKTLKTQGDSRELSIRANAPGDYSIVGVHGKVGGSFIFEVTVLDLCF